jgi:hypothetical protein
VFVVCTKYEHADGIRVPLKYFLLFADTCESKPLEKRYQTKSKIIFRQKSMELFDMKSEKKEECRQVSA